eukprot:Tamp_10266.p1 GENE.Tamp_10266~~Tamp_10266.p1  ORF type:complete len:477 (+),score=55.96 Tamp_10266:199-1431(+)
MGIFKQAPQCYQRVGFLDSLYFSVITMSTIGYGDIVPTNMPSRVWMGVVAVFGLSLFSSILDVIGAWRVACFGDHPSFAKQLLQCSATLVVILGVGVMGYTSIEGLNTQEALYLSLATATTVGYGDLKPQTDRGKLFTVCFALFSLSAFGFVTSCIADAIFPDSDTSVGFGGNEWQWGLSAFDKLLGRSGTAKEFSLQQWPRRFRLFGLVATIVFSFSFLIMSVETHMTYIDAVYWTVMTLTTIGYGDMTTLTERGRALEMVLAVFGLGLFAVFTDVTGRWRRTLPLRDYEGLQSVIGFVTSILAGGVMFSTIEGFAFHDACYLALATSTSIGYGDLYPQTQVGKIATCVYALLSLSVTGVCLSAWGDFLQNQCMGVWEHAHSKVKHAAFDAQRASGRDPLRRDATFRLD